MEPECSSPAPGQPGPSELLNSALRDVIQHLLDNVPHSDFFRNSLSCVVVDDYRTFVPAEREMTFGKILERANALHYQSVATFRTDLQQIYDNAVAYHGRPGGKHGYEPAVIWASDLLAAAEEQLQLRIPVLVATGTGTSQQPRQSDALMMEAEDTATAPTTRPCSAATVADAPSEPTPAAAEPTDDATQDGTQSQHQPQRPSTGGSGSPPIAGSGGGSAAAVAAPGGGADAGIGSAGQQSSSPSSGSGGEGSHSGLEALLAACELAAEQDSAAGVPRPACSHDGTTTASLLGDAGGAQAAAAAATPAPDAVTPPARLSYPGCPSPSSSKPLALAALPPPPQQALLAIVEASPGGAGSQQQLQQHQQFRQLLAPAPQQQTAAASAAVATGGMGMLEEPAGSSEDGGMGGATCAVRNGGTGGPGSGSASGGANAAASSSYLTSNAFKNRRHKSKVYIKPNKVVYLPTTFVEEEFDVAVLPLDCELRVEADGAVAEETFRVTIKAVPRQGLSTMYCMTNVMRFQQQYLNWQIYNWTRIDNNHIMIHLQSPSPSQTQLQRPDLDRSASLPESHRAFTVRTSEDGMAAPRPGGGGGGGAGSLKRKSDTGRYNVTKVERRAVLEPSGIRDWPMDLRLSSNGYGHRPSPIPESPPASPQRRIPAGLAAHLPPRAPAGASSAQPHSAAFLAAGPGQPRLQLHSFLPHHLLPPQQHQPQQPPALHPQQSLVHHPQHPLANLPFGLHSRAGVPSQVGSGSAGGPALVLRSDGGLGVVAVGVGDGPGVDLAAGSGASAGPLDALGVLQQLQQVQQQQALQHQQAGIRLSGSGAGAGKLGGGRGGGAAGGVQLSASQALLLEQHIAELPQQVQGGGGAGAAAGVHDVSQITALQLALASVLHQQQHQQQQLQALDNMAALAALGLVPMPASTRGSSTEFAALPEQDMLLRTLPPLPPQQQQLPQQSLMKLSPDLHPQRVQQRVVRALAAGNAAGGDVGAGGGGADLLLNQRQGGPAAGASRRESNGSDLALGGGGGAEGGSGLAGRQTGATSSGGAGDTFALMQQRQLSQQAQAQQAAAGLDLPERRRTMDGGSLGGDRNSRAALQLQHHQQQASNSSRDAFARMSADSMGAGEMGGQGGACGGGSGKAVTAGVQEAEEVEEIVRRPRSITGHLSTSSTLAPGAGGGFVLSGSDLGLGRIPCFDSRPSGRVGGGAAAVVRRVSHNNPGNTNTTSNTTSVTLSGLFRGEVLAGSAAMGPGDGNLAGALDLSLGGPMGELLSFVSPNKRFKVAVTGGAGGGNGGGNATAQLQAGPVDAEVMRLLEVAMELQVGQLESAAAATVSADAPAFAAAARLRAPGSGLGTGRPVGSFNPELMGQLM